MNTNTKLPDCIRPERIGHGSYGSQSEYDAYGERAPITWVCCCGDRLTLEILDHEEMSYSNVPEAEKAQFLAEHKDCAVTCFNCQGTPVVRAGYWCEKCMWD
jgi:hypothetical protein